jgi:C-terminal processing protease CtpA/Prc
MHQQWAIKTLGQIATAGLLVQLGWSQQLSSLDREQTQVMLKEVASDVRKYYYDPKFHGIDWDARVAEAKEKIAKATSLNTATLEIAAALEPLDDSHTFFIPPRYPIREDYGWRFQMVGDRCYVTRVRPRSDAETKGLKPGDEVLTIQGFTPTRESLHKIEYVLNVLLPQSALQVDLRDHSGKARKVNVMASVRRTPMVTDLGEMTGRDRWALRRDAEDERHLMRARYEELGDGLMILKLPDFLLTELTVQGLINRARKHTTLIVDLRGNSGGAQSTLQYLLGDVFDSDVKIGDRVARATTTPLIAKSNRHDVFTGKLIVLVDGGSASAAELFARVIQIGKRGVVLGERTSGSVMEAKLYIHRTGFNPVISYGAMVADADLLTTDGKSLEHVGVTPDETILPTAVDLANDRDPVMVRAAEVAGVTLSPESVAKLFPFEWPKE